jgi:phosphate transport system substrate-binding protein
MINKEGKTVEPSSTAFQTAAVNAKWDKEDGFYLILTDQPGAASWPITSATFVLVHKEPKDPIAVGEALRLSFPKIPSGLGVASSGRIVA